MSGVKWVPTGWSRIDKCTVQNTSNWHADDGKYFQYDVDMSAYAGKKAVVAVRTLEPTAITDVTATKTAKVVKVVENGQVYILSGDKKYNMMGVEVK